MENKSGNYWLRRPGTLLAGLAATRSRAFVVIVHGFGEHSGRYGNVVDTLVPAVSASMPWTTGATAGARACRAMWLPLLTMRRCAQLFTAVVRSAAGDKPVFLLGHSMGSIIAMNYVAAYSRALKGIYSPAPGPFHPSPAARCCRELLPSSVALPRARIKFPLAPEFISRDPEVVAAYKADPLVHNKISFRLAQGMNESLATGAKAIAAVQLPVLIQCGSEDESFAGQQQLFDSLESKDKTLKIYQGFKHEVYNELLSDRQRALEDLAAWLEQQLNK